MQVVLGIIIAVAAVALIFGAAKWRSHIISEELDNYREKDDSYTLVIDDVQGKPEVTSIILNAGKSFNDFTEEDLSADSFTVDLNQEYSGMPEENKAVEKLKVASVTLCNIDGNDQVDEEKADHILLKLEQNQDKNLLTNYYTDSEGNNCWKKNYQLNIKHSKLNTNILNENSPLITDAAKADIEALKIK